MNKLIIPILLFLFISIPMISQPKEMKYMVIHSDESVTISYGTSIAQTKSGYHVVWVKADYSDPEWQRYFAIMADIDIPVYTTLTKVWYDSIYSFAMVRQVLLYSKNGKILYDTGEDSSAGWQYVNASDPVGIVGEYLGE